jgi:hypothetical protein
LDGTTVDERQHEDGEGVHEEIAELESKLQLVVVSLIGSSGSPVVLSFPGVNLGIGLFRDGEVPEDGEDATEDSDKTAHFGSDGSDLNNRRIFSRCTLVHDPKDGGWGTPGHVEVHPVGLELPAVDTFEGGLVGGRSGVNTPRSRLAGDVTGVVGVGGPELAGSGKAPQAGDLDVDVFTIDDVFVSEDSGVIGGGGSLSFDGIANFPGRIARHKLKF